MFNREFDNYCKIQFGMGSFELSEKLKVSRPLYGGLLYSQVMLYYLTGDDVLLPAMTEVREIVYPRKKTFLARIFKR